MRYFYQLRFPSRCHGRQVRSIASVAEHDIAMVVALYAAVSVALHVELVVQSTIIGADYGS